MLYNDMMWIQQKPRSQPPCHQGALSPQSPSSQVTLSCWFLLQSYRRQFNSTASQVEYCSRFSHTFYSIQFMLLDGILCRHAVCFEYTECILRN